MKNFQNIKIYIFGYICRHCFYLCIKKNNKGRFSGFKWLDHILLNSEVIIHVRNYYQFKKFIIK